MEPTQNAPEQQADPATPANPGPLTDENKMMAAIAHAGGAVGVLVPGASVIAPLIIMLTQKHPFVRAHSVEALNLQVSLFLIYAGLLVINLVTCGLGGIGVSLFWLVGIAAAVFNIIAAIQAYEGKPYTYPLPLWRVVK